MSFASLASHHRARLPGKCTGDKAFEGDILHLGRGGGHTMHYYKMFGGQFCTPTTWFLRKHGGHLRRWVIHLLLLLVFVRQYTNCNCAWLRWLARLVRCHRREWLPSYLTPGHCCLGVNDSRSRFFFFFWGGGQFSRKIASRSLTPRRKWLPEHLYLGMNDSPR